MRVFCMKIPYNGFKIKSKETAQLFIDCVCPNSPEQRIFVNKEKSLYIKKDETGEFHVLIKIGDLHDWFNPLIEIASTNGSYELTDVQAVYRYRKYINKWLHENQKAIDNLHLTKLK